MKAKKFNNLWTSGIILFITILVTMHIIRLVFPNFIVGVVITPTILNFGQVIDNNKYLYYLFYATTTFILFYMYCCACNAVNKLSVYEILIIILGLILCCVLDIVVEKYVILLFTSFYLIFPVCFSLMRKLNIYKTSKRTIVCFVLLAITQVLLWHIRGIQSYESTAIYTVLLIDTYIVDTLFYLFFNYKGDIKNE